jgi:hypothetical protein
MGASKEKPAGVTGGLIGWRLRAVMLPADRRDSLSATSIRFEKWHDLNKGSLNGVLALADRPSAEISD